MRTQSLLYSAASLALLAGSAAAQQAQPAGGITEVTVTAQKSRTAASKTPIALTVVSADQLKQQGVTSVAQLGAAVPSLIVGNSAHGAAISIRGVSSTDVTSKGTQGVDFNLDGVPIGRPEVIQTAFFDLDDVEVLRGPQGTLYGKSSTGGVINVTSAQPKDYFAAGGTFDVGNYNTRRGEFFVNVPVTDQLAIRAAGNFNYRDGYLNPVLGNVQSANTEPKLNDENNMTGRLTARYRWGDDDNVTLTYTNGHIGGTGDTSQQLLSSLNTPQRFNVYYNPMAGYVKDNFQFFNGQVNQDLGSYVHFTYVGGYQIFSADDNYGPATGNPAYNGDAYDWSLYQTHITNNSQEIRFSNVGTSPLEWIVGANYLNEINNESDGNWATPTDCAPSLAASCEDPNPVIEGPTGHKSYGVFGNLTYHLNDQLTLIGGIRYSNDSMYRTATIAAGAGPFYAADGQQCSPTMPCVSGAGILNDTGTEQSSKVTYRAVVQYQITPRNMAYVSFATGYKSGGFNDVDPSNPGHTGPYGPESLDAYEIGYKGRPLENLQFNSDVYYYDYSKYQLTGSTFLTPGALSPAPIVLIYTTLVPATAYGWENDVKWNITPNDTLSAGFDLAQGYYNGGKNHAVVGFIFTNQVNWSHEPFDNLPPWVVTGSYTHRWSLNNGGQLSFTLNTHWSGRYSESNLGGDGNPFSGVYSVYPGVYWQKSFTRTDVDAGYTSANGKYSIDLYARNLEDRQQMTGGIQGIGNTVSSGPANAPGGLTVRVNDPRTYGVRVTLKY